MYRVIIIVILLFTTYTVSAQNDYISADKVTYQYFMDGNWDELIDSTEQFLSEGIDFKTLRQRLGYAYFMKTDYVEASIQYKHAFDFDNSDIISIQYLYFSYLNSGNKIMSNYYANKLPPETQEKLNLKSFRIIDAFDFEYNYKTSYSDIRSAPSFLRFGINSQLAYNLNLYQTISNYKQSFYSTYSTIQNEYFGLLNFTATDNLNLLAGYHYINTLEGTTTDISHVFVGKAVYRLNRFDLGIIYSFFNTELINKNQVGLQIGALIPGVHNTYLSSTLYNLSNSTNIAWVFNQTVGALITKKVWAEGHVTFGNLLNFIDLNGLYVYNSIDPITFRAGLSLYYYLNKHFSIYSNYTYSERNIIDYDVNYTQNSITGYTQHSITGGIIWKI